MKYVALDEVAFTIHNTAVEKGFWDAADQDRIIFYLKQLAMVHSEVSETLEAIRKEKGERVIVEEMADTIIRILDLWAGMKIDGYISSSLEEVLEEKARYNTTRKRLHGVLA